MKNYFTYLILFISSIGFAQVTTSSINGVVTEKSIPASLVTVQATHVPSGTVYEVLTNDNGRFNLANMRIGGPYTVVFSYVGAPQVFENIFLQLGHPFTMEVQLRSETLLDEVVITKDGSSNNNKKGVSTVLSRQKIEEMPAISRSITDLTKLTPQGSSAGEGFSFAGRNALFNSLTLDGAQMNNAFGLSSLPGGQTGAQPFSLDAVEAIQINLSPYDVKQGGFTGAGVNAITKSGSNSFAGSIYTYYKDQDLQSYKVDGLELPKTETYSNKQYGLSLGGPIVKNKLFFFINGETTRRVTPATNFVANRGVDGPNVSNVTAKDLDAVKNTLLSRFGFDPGVYEGYNNEQQADNITARIDWNINEVHKLTFRYNYLKSFRDLNASGSNSRSGRGPSLTSMTFSGLRYKMYNNINSFTAELNSNISSQFANNLQLVYSGFRDYRETFSGAFPLVDIENGSNSNYISFGSEPFSGLNKLDQDIITITNNFNIFAGDHTFTLGGSVGFQQYKNAFAQMFNGQFRYKSIDDFTKAAEGDTSVNPLLYQLTYSTDPNNREPAALFKMIPISFYAQDEWYLKPNFKLSYGLRFDLPVYTARINSNPLVNQMTFRDGEKLDVGSLPKTAVLVSPRMGFNWDVHEDNSLVIRGGTGIFTGGVPGVWLTNQAGNTGMMFGNESSANPDNRPFNPDPSAYIPNTPSTPNSFAINATAKNFKMPQISRSNLGIDYTFPGGLVATVEGIYTKSINEVYHRDANLKNPEGQYSGTGDKRDYFQGSPSGVNQTLINPQVTNAIVLDNTSQGYAYNITAQLYKKFGKFGDAMIAYTYSDARDITSNPGSQANSAFTGNPTVNDPNNPVLAYSSFVVRNRIIAAVNLNFNISSNLPSRLGLIYEGRPASDGFGNTRYSYTIAGDISNTGGRFSNSLMYVPKDRSDIVLVDLPEVRNSEGVITQQAETADQQWNRLSNFIDQDKYLSGKRGEFSERNGAEYPWMNRFDLRFTQELLQTFNTKNKHRLQITVDIINVGNLLNNKWGVVEAPNMTNFMQFKGAVDNTPTYTVNQKLSSETFRTNTGMDSRYQIQLGLRYIFE